MFDPGIPGALTMAVVLLSLVLVGSLLSARHLRRQRKLDRLEQRAAWRRDWLVAADEEVA